MIFALTSCEKDAVRIDDIDMFINETYYSNDPEDASWKYYGENAYEFFPSYDEIKYDYSDIKFYVYSYSDLFFYPDITYVLELKFDNKQSYDVAKQDIFAQYNFLQDSVKEDRWPYSTIMPQATYTIGNYTVKIITQGEQDNFPNNVYAICENQTDFVIRYLYVYDLDNDALNADDFIDGIIESSNCKW